MWSASCRLWVRDQSGLPARCGSGCCRGGCSGSDCAPSGLGLTREPQAIRVGRGPTGEPKVGYIIQHRRRYAVQGATPNRVGPGRWPDPCGPGWTGSVSITPRSIWERFTIPSGATGLLRCPATAVARGPNPWTRTMRRGRLGKTLPALPRWSFVQGARCGDEQRR